MNLTEMRRWLDLRGIQLTNSLGHKFLPDGNQLRRIVAAGEVVPGAVSGPLALPRHPDDAV